MGLANLQASADLLRGHASTDLLTVVEMNTNLTDGSNNTRRVKKCRNDGEAKRKITAMCSVSN